MKRISKGPKETAILAETFLEKILNKKTPAGATVVGLSGDLGAGKTTLVKFIAKHLGIKTTLSSPTFVIMKKYPIKKKGSYKFFFHLDAYRLKNQRELERLGWKDIIKDPENLVFIEWPENVGKAMPEDSRMIYISHQGGNQRHFRVV